MNKNSKFYTPSLKPTFKERMEDLKYTILFWKGRKMKYITTRNLEWSDLRYIFFPTKEDKYGYLNITFYKDSEFNKVLLPLVLAMDYEAKPKWCPRWVLRFLHLFGSDNSIVRVRNFTLHNWEKKLTKGMMMWDYKTKWTEYDLRISINAPKHLQDLADYIEAGYYSKGRQEELVGQIKAIDPDANIVWGSVDRLVDQLNRLKDSK